MPQERIYEQQTTPRPAAAMPLATPDQYGAQIGGALGQAGQQVHQAQVRAFQVEKAVTRDRELADWSHKFAQHRQNLGDIARQMRSTAAPGGLGHTQGIDQNHEAARETLLGGITDPEVRRHAERQWQEFGKGLHDEEAGFEEGQRIAKTVGDRQQTVAIEANTIRRSGDPKAYAAALDRLYADNALLGVDPATRDKLDRWGEQAYAVGFIGYLQDTNPQAARAVLDAGEFDFLPADVLEQLRSGSDVEIRRAEAAAERQAAVGEADYRERVATVKARAENGQDTSADLPGLIAEAEQRGDPSTAEQLRGVLGDAVFAKTYAEMTPLQREQRIVALAALKQPSAAQQQELAYARQHSGALDSAFNQDPAGFMVTHGHPAPPAEQGAARSAWARTMSKATGRQVWPFTAEEKRALAEQKATSAAGELQVLQLLDAYPEGADRAAAAQQIAPADQTFQALAQLDPNHRTVVRQGQEALKANPRLVAPSESEFPDQHEVMAELDQRVRRALKEYSPAGQQAVITVAQQFMAGVLAQRGHGPDAISEALYDTAIRVALGGGTVPGKGAVGGLGRWGDHAVVLPDGVTSAEFGQRLGTWWGRNRPLNPDGKTPIPVDRVVPVLIGPNLYRFEAGGRVVRNPDGSPLIGDFSR